MSNVLMQLIRVVTVSVVALSDSTSAQQAAGTAEGSLLSCRQRCYDQYQQWMRIYCPTPYSFYCYYYYYYFAIQTNLCYAVCTTPPPAPSSTTVTTTIDSPLAGTPSATSLSAWQACRQQCYDVYIQQIQTYCYYTIYFYCYYSNALAAAHYACYDQCNATYNSPVITTTTTTPTTTTPSTSRSCGIQRAILNRIVGGGETAECELPWTVFILVGTRFCGGSILDSDTVLTAAHCIYFPANGSANPSTVTIHYGSAKQSLTRIADVTDVKVHPKFNMALLDYDVAVLKLAKPLQYDACTQPICLPEADVTPPATCTVAGWGALDFSQQVTQEILRKVTLPVVSESDCMQAYRDTRIISDRKLCAGDTLHGGADACVGDSGGPLICDVDGVYFQHGVVSFGEGCGEARYPGVYARLSHPDIHAWIVVNL